ncbi:MAG: chemotaxis protein CheV [Gammaproteobacteria bacterium]|nr:chemotaxis protein CheV [Gammaproteobacteria bacterium]MBL6998429.1 chemotaxis protein CheV [Gammaproteobacteria bacterium]
MSDLLTSVDKRTQLAGHNRLELLTFQLVDQQLYGINVFKVREVLQCPQLSPVPRGHPVVRGLATIRGNTLSILDLSLAIGGQSVVDTQNTFVIITEYNGSVQGFLVSEVDRIVNLDWKQVKLPPIGASYLTAITYVNDVMIEVIDIERVLSEVMGAKEGVSAPVLANARIKQSAEKNLILVVDDSVVARQQICHTIEEDMGLETVTQQNGQQALDMLQDWIIKKDPRLKRLAMVISDIEMPEMDGYTLTTRLRDLTQFRNMHIILHTSMSGVFNQSMVDRVGANKFLAKFDPDRLAMAIIEALQLANPD